MWKYRMRKGNEENVTEKRQREQVRKPKRENICNKIKLLATNLTAPNNISYILKVLRSTYRRVTLKHY